MKTRCCYPKRYLLLFFSLLVSVGSILMSVSLSSCSSSVKSPLLLSADSLMEIYPDSALSILESISSPQKLPRADRALYALLLTQARHKNYIALGDDSLIKTAVEYYGDKKKSVRAAKAHYYWGATYLEKGYTSFAVEEYLAAIRLMPIRNEFLAMIYDNLAECYEKDGLNNVAMEAYRTAYQILEGESAQVYPLRGIAGIFFSQNEKDSALYYYQQALDCALVVQDSSMIGAIYHDFAMIYNEKKDYIRADQYISKAIMVMGHDEAANAYLLKAEIMFNLNKLDSASYFFNKEMGSLDIIILLVAVILIFQKLRSLLGTRPDTEITRTKISEESAAKIFDMIVKEAEKQQQTAVEKDSVPEENMSDLDKTLVKIPGFNKERFITGAKRAFEIIVTAFSKGDTETLENLVSKSLIKKFQEIIEKRRAEGISAETDLIGFDQAEITAAKISKNDIAKITVKFVSEQVNLLKNKDDEIIEGDENFIQNITDVWTFERCLTSTNPNWLLVSTKK